MRRGLFWISFAVALVVALPSLAADKTSDKTDPKDKLVASAYFDGSLTQLDTTSKWFTVQVTQKIQVPNLDAQRNLASLQQQKFDALRIANPIDRAQKLQSINVEIAKNVQNQFSYQDKHYTFELQAADTMKVRLRNPPVAFDDKGKPKKYTSKELAELKGPDKKLPGYTGDFDNLRTGQKVGVYLAKKKYAGKAAKSDDKDAPSDKRLSVVMIVILQDAPK
jgi:hypothetical protein